MVQATWTQRTRTTEQRKPMRVRFGLMLMTVVLACVYGCTARQGSSDIHEAVRRGSIQDVRMSLEEGVNVNMRDRLKNTPIIIAAARGRRDVVELLLAHDAHLEMQDIGNRTALVAAAGKGHGDIVKLLLSKGADLGPKPPFGKTALIMLVQSTCPPEKAKDVIDILVKYGADLDAQEADGITALMWAVLNEDAGKIRVLLDAGADSKVKDSKGATALDMAKKAGFQRGVEILSASE